jgi:hypothetical protein
MEALETFSPCSLLPGIRGAESLAFFVLWVEPLVKHTKHLLYELAICAVVSWQKLEWPLAEER